MEMDRGIKKDEREKDEKKRSETDRQVCYDNITVQYRNTNTEKG
jgi:hypothetical protein